MMAEEDKTAPSNIIPAALSSPRPESPTTARPLDFDDEPQESGITTVPSTTASQPPPAKPPRPLSPQQQAENTLKEAFPTIDAGVVKAVLVASGYQVERAFHALLGMTDPSAQEEVAPPKPPRPSRIPTSTTQRQLEADELYARQLAEHYNSTGRHMPPQDDRYPRRGSENSEERDYSFFDDDLPVIRENIRKGFLETQSKVNTWVQNLKKRLDGDDLDDIRRSQQRQDGSQPYNTRPRRSGDTSRRAGDRNHYDADPQLLGDDFSALELRDDEAPPPRPARPLANPNLFKTSSPSPDRRNVSFQQNFPAEMDDLYEASQPNARAPFGGSKSSKWQPLSAADPSPVVENDPFSLGDSEDEKETKQKDHAEDGERIKQATAEAMAGEIGEELNGDNKAK
ncbi:hypothetical protein ASPZODRAFT_163664 [Penicilliopsis zonata CBS 506.65]|uniref:CUE domain-containing protein n=1 Tax=Penicilliopsis zonata CBS 506.65 TaxID=1073090 RepID=A0A1L9SQQ4_9EURO|nr:hypothetical protein ASPZODRAFT_163664 [Penicilliopsis zonata CBS 506.65]OJJ49562.1 hypothetical protein ASPZODRAFT_163664 [Penicilliopsis zonata CBS 506.65]